ncbi:MAG: multicopper oxidase domain-containing protein [Nitrososphaerales archaeon]
MQTQSALIATSLLLLMILSATIVSSIILSPSNLSPKSSTTVITARVTTSSGASTSLVVSLSFPNSTRFSEGALLASQHQSVVTNGSYVFNSLVPGNYSMSVSGNESVFLPPTTIKVSPGTSYANLTIYTLKIFTLIETSGLSYNNSQHGPAIIVENGTGVRIIIKNNTTLIHNLGVVQALGNVNASNIMFSSLSETLNAGGSTNDTFLVNKVGSFYYECLIGNHARDGEYGFFIVMNVSSTTRGNA